MSYRERGAELGKLVESKQKQYGDSAGKSGGIMRILYPQGIASHQMDDALLTVRVLDKLSRIAQRGEDGKDLGGESPWKDLAGYGLLGWAKDEPRGNQLEALREALYEKPSEKTFASEH